MSHQEETNEKENSTVCRLISARRDSLGADRRFRGGGRQCLPESLSQTRFYTRSLCKDLPVVKCRSLGGQFKRV
jgi:hypothetical protein